MNLYIFNATGRAAVYGIGTFINELAQALRYSDINTYIVNINRDIPHIQKEAINGINYWSFPAPKSEYPTKGYENQDEIYYLNVVYLLQLYIEDKTDLVFHLNDQHSIKFAEELKRKFKCRIVITIHYLDWCFKLSGNVLRFKRIVKVPQAHQVDELGTTVKMSVLKEKAFFERADRIHCLSENMRQLLQDDYQIKPDMLTVIYNGLNDIHPASDKQALRQKYHLPDLPFIIFAGRLDEMKGLKYALQAFKTLLHTHPNSCHFIIAGDGAFKEHLKECEDIWMHVTWTGLLSKDKLHELYSIVDIGIVPSLYEPFGYVAVEMMMHGLPVIATATSGLNEVADETCGFKIPVVEYLDSVHIDTNLLAEKMLYLLHHPQERTGMGTNARKRYEEHFTGDVFRKNMLNFYHSFFGK